MRRLRGAGNNLARGGFPGGRNPMTGGAGFGLVLLLGGAWFFSNALYNVDGGHRAIKYKRISGVGKEIYNEGKSRLIRPLCQRIETALAWLLTLMVF